MDQVLTTQCFDPATATGAQQERASEIGKQWYLALAFLMGSDRAQFDSVLEKLENEFTQGQDIYPNTVTDAYILLISWKEDRPHLVCLAGNDGVTFTTTASTSVKQEEDAQEHTNDGSQEQKTNIVNVTARHRKQSKGRN